MNVKEIGADQDVVSEGDKPSECCLILKGHACRSKMTPDGKRQIMSFHIQGEVPDFQSLYLKTVDHSLGGSGPTLFRSSRACLLTGSTRLHFRWPIGQSMDFGLPR